MDNILRQYQWDCIDDVFSRLEKQHKRITVLIPTGAGRTTLALFLANRIARELNKRIILVVSRRDIKEQCENLIEVYNLDKIVVTLFNNVYQNGFSDDCLIILLGLQAYERKVSNQIMSEWPGSIISIGEPIFSLSEDKKQSDDPILNELNSLPSFVNYNNEVIKINIMVYSTMKILDVRDIILADDYEKKVLLKEIRNQRNKLAHGIATAISEKNLLDESLKKYRDQPKERDKYVEELEKKDAEIAKMQRLIEYQQQLLSSVGISKNAVEKSFIDIENLRNKLKDDLCSNNEKVREYAISKLETFVAESIVSLTNRTLTVENSNRYQNIIESYLGEDVWNKMERRSKTFLVSALMNYDSMTHLPEKDALDYSGVCLSVTKSLDVEISKRFYERYISYLETLYPLKTKIDKWPNTMLNKDKTDIIQPNDFTLGSVAYVVGVDETGAVRNRYVFNMFKDFALKELYKKSITNIEQEKKIKNCIRYIEKIRKDYRNPAAHRNELDIITAENCIDYMIETYKKLKEILEDMKI